MKRRVSRSPWRSQRQPAGGEGPGLLTPCLGQHRRKAWGGYPTDEQGRMFKYAERFALSRRDVCVGGVTNTLFSCVHVEVM
jgi:hypothetical protein